MPAVRTRPRDVLVRVAKVEPNSNDYLAASTGLASSTKSPSHPAAAPAAGADGNGVTSTSHAAAGGSRPAGAAAQTSGAELIGIPLDGGSKLSSVTAPEQTTDPARAIAAASSSSSSSATATLPLVPPPDAKPLVTTSATQKAQQDGGKTDGDKGQGGGKNPPTIGLVTQERDEKEAVKLAKASTSSAEWNSLLVWARRQRGPQWDSATGIWQVDRYSEEYYRFSSDPSQSVQSKTDTTSNQARSDADGVGTLPLDGAGATTLDSEASRTNKMDEDDDRGPLSRSWRGGSRDESPPPVAHGRSARLLRR